MNNQKFNWLQYCPNDTIGVYKITNKINGKCYIGSSSDISGRFSNHFKKQLKKAGHRKFYREINYFEKENFDFEILETLEVYDKQKLLELECKYYDLYRPEYNEKRPDEAFNKNKTMNYSRGWYEKHQDSEYRQNMSKIKKESGWSKPIKMTNRENQELHFDSFREGAKYIKENYGCLAKNPVSKIRDCVLGKRKSYYGCNFELESVETISKESTSTIDT